MGQRMRLELFYDLGSPYSFLAFEALLRYEAVWDTELVLTPVVVGAIFAAVGGASPAAACPPKAHYLNAVDIKRAAQHFGVPALRGVPSNLGKPGYSTLQALRLVVAAQEAMGSRSQEVVALSRAIFSSIFGTAGEPTDPSDRELLWRACMGAGLPVAAAQQLLDSSRSMAVKQRLKANTERAVQAGAFGVPTVLVQDVALGPGEHLFFGSDRLEQLAYLCGLPWEGPQPQVQLQPQPALQMQPRAQPEMHEQEHSRAMAKL